MSYNLTLLFPEIFRNYKNQYKVQQDVQAFVKENVTFVISQSQARNSQGQPCQVVALQGKANYAYQSTQNVVELVFYIDYEYPTKQPKVLVIAGPGQEFNPSSVVQANGVVQNAAFWSDTSDLRSKLSELLQNFQYNPPFLRTGQPIGKESLGVTVYGYGAGAAKQVVQQLGPYAGLAQPAGQVGQAASPYVGLQFNAQIQQLVDQIQQKLVNNQKALKNNVATQRQANATICAEISKLLVSGDRKHVIVVEQKTGDREILEAAKKKKTPLQLELLTADAKIQASDALMELMCAEEVQVDLADLPKLLRQFNDLDAREFKHQLQKISQ